MPLGLVSNAQTIEQAIRTIEDLSYVKTTWPTDGYQKCIIEIKDNRLIIKNEDVLGKEFYIKSETKIFIDDIDFTTKEIYKTTCEKDGNLITYAVRTKNKSVEHYVETYNKKDLIPKKNKTFFNDVIIIPSKKCLPNCLSDRFIKACNILLNND